MEKQVAVFPVGVLVRARVVRILQRGALCEVQGSEPAGVHLNIHVSQIANEFVEDVGDYLQVGDEFSAVIILSRDGVPTLSARSLGGLSKRGS